MYVLSFKPAIGPYGVHDPSAALFKDGELLFAVEEERYSRTKHAENTFPEKSIQACLKSENISLSDVDKIILPYIPRLTNKIWKNRIKKNLLVPKSFLRKVSRTEDYIKTSIENRFFGEYDVRTNLENIGKDIPNIEHKSHHKCHAASAFYPSGFDNAIILTVDGKGEYDSTVIWKGSPTGLTRLKTFQYPNSIGHFYASVTEFLGYHAFNGEGKVMGLAPYGESNSNIENTIRSVIDTSAEYDVTEITRYDIDHAVEQLESLFSRQKKESPNNFTDWEKDLAYVTQTIIEKIILNLIEKYTQKLNENNICLAGGVALNCKMNRVIENLESVDNLFVQPVANDAGLALGGGYLTVNPTDVDKLNNVYLGPEYNGNIEKILKERKLESEKVENVPAKTAKYIAENNIVGWFQGRLEMGPRALGNRSILADPRTIESRDQVNKYVKHREEWRPFAPSLKQEALDEYLIDANPSPFMIKTYKIRENKADKIPAVLHPADGTTRPQTVRKDQNPRYHSLLDEFEKITDIPVLLNTSFNDHAEPIVNHPVEAIKDFFGMGLDVLVIEDYIIKK